MALAKLKGFFNAKSIIDAVDKAKERVGKKQGAFIRTSARSSIKKNKKPSAPGQPPHGHTGGLRKRIFFDYDRITETVVVGPALAPLRTNKFNLGLTTPQRLELGGRVIVNQTFTRKDGWRIVTERQAQRARTTRRQVRRLQVTTDQRPFMLPALKKGLTDLARKWKGAVR